MFKSQKCDVHAKSCVSTKMHTVVIPSKCCLLNRLTLPSFSPFPSPSPPPSSSPPGAVVWASTSFRRHTMRRKCRINDRLLLETMFDRQISQRIPSWWKLLVYCITHQRRARQRLVTFGKDELHLVKPACWWNRICGLGEGIVRRIMRRSNVCYSSLWMMYCFSGLARDTRDTEKQKILYVEQLRALKLGTRNVKGQLKLRYCSIWMISLSRKEMIKNGMIGIGKF